MTAGDTAFNISLSLELVIFFETTTLSRCGGLMCNFVFFVRLISGAEALGQLSQSVPACGGAIAAALPSSKVTVAAATEVE